MPWLKNILNPIPFSQPAISSVHCSMFSYFSAVAVVGIAVYYFAWLSVFPPRLSVIKSGPVLFEIRCDLINIGLIIRNLVFGPYRIGIDSRPDVQQ